MSNPALSSARTASISASRSLSRRSTRATSGAAVSPAAALRGWVAVLVFAPLLAACGGSSAADYARETIPTGSGSLGGETAAASAAPSAEAEVGFMRVGDVTPASLAEAPTTTAAAPPPPPVDPSGPRKASTGAMATASPNARGASDSGGGQTKASDERGHEAPKPAPNAAVVDSNGNLSEAEVRATIVSRQSTFRECYELGASSTASFSGTVQLKVAIGPTGSVASVDILTSTTKNAQVDSCVTQAVRRIQFPAKGNGAVVAFPIEFGR